MTPSLRRSRRSSSKAPTQTAKHKKPGRKKKVVIQSEQASKKPAVQEMSAGRRGRRKKTVALQNETKELSQESSATPPNRLRTDAVTARAERSLRRQRQMDEMTPANIKRNATRPVHKSTTNAKRVTNTKDEEVVKVKLNTGTLYMYRGENRRVVFVRRV